jgi:hypothetical protein
MFIVLVFLASHRASRWSLFLFLGAPDAAQRVDSTAPLPPRAAAAALLPPRCIAASLFLLEAFFFLSRLVLFHLKLKLRFSPSGGGDAGALLDLQWW